MHITVSEPSPEAKTSALAPLSLQRDGGEPADNNATAAAARNPRRQQQQQQCHLQQAANVSITITDASPDGGSAPKPLPATTAHTKRLAFRRASETKIVQHKALVHRTSEGPHS